MSKESAFDHPFDTPLTAGLRFLAELIAWLAGAWAAAQVSFWLAIPVLVLLVGLPAVFSTPGDKKQVVVATPGPARALLEFGLYSVAVVCVWATWPIWLAIISTVVVFAAVVFGLPRIWWLFRGAPSVSR
jgi:hypothetical protein